MKSFENSDLRFALEADPETIARVFSAASFLGKKIKEKTGAVGVNLLANCGEDELELLLPICKAVLDAFHSVQGKTIAKE